MEFFTGIVQSRQQSHNHSCLLSQSQVCQTADIEHVIYGQTTIQITKRGKRYPERESKMWIHCSCLLSSNSTQTTPHIGVIHSTKLHHLDIMLGEIQNLLLTVLVNNKVRAYWATNFLPISHA